MKRATRRVVVDDNFDRSCKMLVQMANHTIGLWDEGDHEYRKFLYFTMIEMAHEMKGKALEKGGFGKSKGTSHDIFRAKVKYLTGEDLDHAARCEGTTVSGARCRNYPWVGERYCHVHGSEAERKRFVANTKRWDEHFSALMRELGFADVARDLWERINETKEYE